MRDSRRQVFFGLLNAECSDLEGLGTTEAEQSKCAEDFADQRDADSLFCSIDGVPCVENLAAYRFQSPQFKFKVPTPWVFRAIGGKGTAVSDGYFRGSLPCPRECTRFVMAGSASA